MSAYVLKLIAIITMVFDHSGYLIYGHLSWMNFVGRIAFPIFAFQISEGYIHTHNLKKYFVRLIIFALISQIPYAWFGYCFFSKMSLNIIFTLILGLLSISIYEFIISKGTVHCTPTSNCNFSSTVEQNNNNNISEGSNIFQYKLLGIIIVLIIAVFADIFGFDYGFYGVFIIFLFYLYRNNKLSMNIAITILTFIYYTPYFMASNFKINYIGLFICSLIPLIFINLYNGQKGRNYKMLFYIFYPVHLLVLCLIYILLH